MDITTFNSLAQKTSFEIEQDMRILHKTQKTGKVSVQDYVESIAARYPLLGLAVIAESNRKAIEDSALEAIRISLDHRKVYNWACLAVFLTMIQYAKNWERVESSGFWAYICEQLGHKYSQQIYDVLTSSVKIACQSYNRLFVFDPNGDNSYYTTVLAHSLAPSKSFYALCDFLVKFYKNNLDYSVYEEDPAIGRMVGVLRDRCQGATTEQDEDISGNVSGIQTGLRALITTRPGYMKHFLTKTLQKIDTLLHGDELSARDYTDVLLTQWFVGKLTAPTIKRSSPTHKRTTEIAFSYGKIRVEYILDYEGEPAVRIPSIRLSSHENPILKINSNGNLVFQYTVGIYGNDYAATSEEVNIPFSEISDADHAELNVEITIGGKQIYSSGISLNAKALLFKEGKLQTGRSLEEGNYVLFAPKSVNIKFEGNVESQRRSYFAQLFDIYVQGETSIFADGRLLFCSRPPEGSLRFRLPKTQLEYQIRDTVYPLFSREELSITATGAFLNKKVEATTQAGKKLLIQSQEANLCQFHLPPENGAYCITLTDENTGVFCDEIRLFIVNSYSVEFDSEYYLESAEDGNVTLNIDGQHFEMSLMGFGSKVKVPYCSGEIQIQIPRIRLLLDGDPRPTETVWKGEILPSSILHVLCPESLPVSIAFGDSQMPRRSCPGGFEYSIGNSVQAYDGTADKVSVSLLVAEGKLRMFDVVYKMSLTDPPKFNLSENTLIWLNSQAFVGDKTTTFKFVFSPKHGSPITLFANQNQRFLSEDFPSKSERYHYQIVTKAETAFGITESTLSDGFVIFGDIAAVVFRGETLRIAQVIEEGKFSDIKPFFAEGITYLGTENLGFTDLNGDYAHYTAKLFFMTRNGKIYFSDLNPVDIYLVNEKSGILHISFRDGDGLFVDRSGDCGTELYKHVDPPQQLQKYFNIPDFFLFQYSKEMF